MSPTLTELIDGGSPISHADVERFVSSGHWRGQTIRSVLREAAAAYPDREALVGYRSDGTTPRWSYRELDRDAGRAAASLATLGVEPGDAVAVMLPNWIEYAALIFGINEIGAVYIGIPVAYGELQARRSCAAARRRFSSSRAAGVRRATWSWLASCARDAARWRRWSSMTDSTRTCAPEEVLWCIRRDAAAGDPGAEHPGHLLSGLHVRHDRRAEGGDAHA